MKTIEIRELTREAFAPFGQVIEQDGAHNFPINAGKCTRYHDLANIETTGEKARPVMEFFDKAAQVMYKKVDLVISFAPYGVSAFIASNIGQASQGIAEVNENVAQSTVVIADITRDIAGINQQSSQVGDGSGQVQQSAQGLAELAAQLEQLVRQFKV